MNNEPNASRWRLKSLVEYDGTNYHGWQMQVGQSSIQDTLTRAWSTVNSAPVILHAAGRTDSGVHALGQVVHCEVTKHLPVERWQAAVNSLIPPDIRLRSVVVCDPTFHARNSAREKTYLYRFWKGRVVSPFWHRYVLPVPADLDWEAMSQAAQQFLGTHDFTPFTVVSCEVESHIRTLHRIELSDTTEDLCSIEFTGTGFLRYMVRRMVGILLEIGRGRLPHTAVAEQLSGKTTSPVPTAPAKGLTLLRVDY